MKRICALLLAAVLLLTACSGAAPEKAPVSDAVAPPAPAEGPTEEAVIDLLRRAEAIYQPGNFDILSAVSQENFIDGAYYDEVGGYEEAVAGIFTQNGIEQLEETVFLELPLFLREDGKVYRQSAMTDSAVLRCYELIDAVALTARDSGNYFYEITHVPLPKGYTAEDRHKVSTLVSPLTIVWQDGCWKVDFFAAFGQDAIACGTPVAPTEEEFLGQLPGNISAPGADAYPAQAHPLTEEEIAQVNTAFEPIVNHAVNPLGLFLMSWYQSPEWLDLTEFLRYFPQSTEVENPDEFEALKAHENWSWPKDAELDMMPVPIHRIAAGDVEQLLQQYMGVGIDDITYHPGSELIYLEEYDCFYNFTSDAGFGAFQCTEGCTMEDGTLVMTDGAAALTMKQAGDGRWLFYSYLPLEPVRCLSE